MRSRKTAQTTVIRKAGRRGNNNAVSSGAWKVAFADFTLAMMALFMVLWIINSVSEDDRKQIMAQINGTSMFIANPFSPISTTADFMAGKNFISNHRVSEREKEVPDPTPDVQPVDAGDGDGDGEDDPLALTETQEEQLMQQEPLDDVLVSSQEEMQELVLIIMKITEEHNAQSNLQLDIIPQGLRILVQDDQHREMFQRGSALLTPFFRQLLQELAPVFSSVDNKIVITGHTDATPYPKGVQYDNWNLSGERALAARQALEQGGLSAKQVIQVSGMADQMLLDTQDPEDTANRRIEIMILTRTAADTLYQFFGHGGEKVVRQAADNIKRAAQPEPPAPPTDKADVKAVSPSPAKAPAGSASKGTVHPVQPE